MKIHSIESATTGATARLQACVEWEDCDRPARTLFVDTDARYREQLVPNANAFLTAAFVPAMQHCERRVHVDGSICPRLRDGLASAQQWLARWYDPDRHDDVTIEAAHGFAPPAPVAPPRTGCYMSGGVDALSTLRHNRLCFPQDHEGAVTDCLIVHGFDIGGYEHEDSNRDHFELACRTLDALVDDAGVTLIPVHTNVRHLDDDDGFFVHRFHGAALCSIAHAFSRRVRRMLLPSSFQALDLTPWGSHPDLDACYSSADMTIHHEGLRFSRLDKVGIIANWDVAMRILRSCYMPFRRGLNCGECEKCVRTMTELLVHGALHRCATFEPDDVSADLMRRTEIYSADDDWQHLVEPLTRMGRDDLVDIIHEKLALYYRRRRADEGRDWRGRLKALDRNLLGGAMLRVKRAWRAP